MDYARDGDPAKPWLFVWGELVEHVVSTNFHSRLRDFWTATGCRLLKSESIRHMPRFFIEGKNGVFLDFWVAENKNPVFVMYDGDGKRRVAILGLKNQQSSISFFDSKKQERCTLGLGEAGDPRLIMNDADKVNRARLMVDSTGTSAFDLLDDRSRGRVVFQVDQKGNADGVVFDSDGSPKWRSGK